jgi:hypothetical protein
MRALLVPLLVLAAASPQPGHGIHSCGKLAVKFRLHAVFVYAGHTRCRTARRVGRAWVTGRTLRGWRCRAVPTDSGSFPRCVRGRHPRRVAELDVIVAGA